MLKPRFFQEKRSERCLFHATFPARSAEQHWRQRATTNLIVNVIFLCVFSPQRLNSAIIYDRDFSYNYFGFKVKNVALDTENCSFAIFLGLSLLGRLVILQNHLDLGKGHWSRCDVSGFVRSEGDLQKAVAQLDESCALFWRRCLPLAAPAL